MLVFWTLGGCSLSGSGVVTPIELEPMSASDERVGASCVALTDWRATGAELGVESKLSIRGEELSLTLEWPADAEFPTVFHLLPQGEGELQVVPLTWRTVLPSILATTTVSLPSAELHLQWNEGELTGKWYEKARHSAQFRIEGVEHEAWFVDGDLDGRLDG
jgi:hypothetical protein